MVCEQCAKPCNPSVRFCGERCFKKFYILYPEQWTGEKEYYDKIILSLS